MLFNRVVTACALCIGVLFSFEIILQRKRELVYVL